MMAADRNDNNCDYETTYITKRMMVTVIDVHDN